MPYVDRGGVWARRNSLTWQQVVKPSVGTPSPTVLPLPYQTPPSSVHRLACGKSVVHTLAASMTHAPCTVEGARLLVARWVKLESRIGDAPGSVR